MAAKVLTMKRVRAGERDPANPRKSNRPHVDAMVGNLLSREK
jgi:hypothetical protein